MRRRITRCLTILTALAILCKAGSNSAVPSYSVEIFSEYNDTAASGRELSDRSSGMPDARISIVATLLLGPDPLPFQEVVFTCGNDSLLEPVGDSWPVYATTNGMGQARVIVRGKGSGNGTDVTVTCSYILGVNTYHNSTSIRLYSESPSAQNSPLISGAAALAPACAIKYLTSTTYMSGSVAFALSDGDDTGKVAFQYGAPALIEFDEYINPSDGNYALTETFAFPRAVHFNSFRLDGDPLHATYPSWFPPAGWRHHLRAVASHELGHALSIGHNSSRYAVMHEWITFYFVWLIQSPQSGELAPFHSLYPDSCY